MKHWWLLLVLGCNSGPPTGPRTTYFWNITGSSIEWGNLCSDETAFRTSARAQDFTSDSYLIYRISDDGKQAVSQSCTRIDPASCVPADGGIVWSVAGSELSFSDEHRQETGVGACALVETQQWTLVDQGSTMERTIVDTLSLVDDQPNCDRVESQTKARAPNGQGYQGCQIVWRMTGNRTLPEY